MPAEEFYHEAGDDRGNDHEKHEAFSPKCKSKIKSWTKVYNQDA